MTKSFDEWNYPTASAKAAWDYKQAEIDELRKRIDKAIKCMEQNKPSFPMDFKHAVDALAILKGNTNED